jgi:hypothetical protein
MARSAQRRELCPVAARSSDRAQDTRTQTSSAQRWVCRYFKLLRLSLASSTLTPHFGQSYGRPLKIAAALIARLVRQRGQQKPKPNTPTTLTRRNARTAARNMWFSHVACQLAASMPTAIKPTHKNRYHLRSVCLIVIIYLLPAGYFIRSSMLRLQDEQQIGIASSPRAAA